MLHYEPRNIILSFYTCDVKYSYSRNVCTRGMAGCNAKFILEFFDIFYILLCMCDS
jgi:hypothetical protein